METNTPSDTETFGTWLKTKRTEKGLTQRILADKIGISESYLVKLERDFRYPKNNQLIKPSLEIVAALAEILKTDMDEVRRRAGYDDQYGEQGESVETPLNKNSPRAEKLRVR